MIFYIVKFFLKIFYDPVLLGIYTYRWKKINKHNFTYPVVIFPLEKVLVGNNTYGPLEVYSYTRKKDEFLCIGSFCSIAKGVKFILGGNHFSNFISTYPFKSFFLNEEEAFSKGDIILEDDVWIGTDCLILSGVKLGQGCVVAAGSIVTKSFPPYSVIGGNPAKIIKKRFNDEIIEKLLKLDFNSLTDDFIKKNIDIFYSEDINKNLSLLKNV
ncbi:CatB-related O-acetyltransferase [Chryseobacterium sp. Chry.R1]|uniref:CatB-related O-acetyltransferase n=1 Tax=unclassified Chryseobacterium TaxID=2593645 RepID=UPI0015561653|nr:CatB-related O-acetyltransferase [Chryseobacterium sp. LAM-KRS1]WBV58523.1 CatB-related O-acetyltransferase [Chryseobacterium daecheongense]